MSRPAARSGGAAGLRLRAARYLRLHARAYAVAAVIFLLVDLAASDGRWFFWPVLVWGAVVLLHSMCVNIVRLDDDWAAGQAREIGDRAYDLSHIEDIRKRYRGVARPGDKAKD